MASRVDLETHTFHLVHDRQDKIDLLDKIVFSSLQETGGSAILFFKSKAEAKRIRKVFADWDAPITDDCSLFNSGEARVIVALDDLNWHAITCYVSFVICWDPAESPEVYTRRSSFASPTEGKTCTFFRNDEQTSCVTSFWDGLCNPPKASSRTGKTNEVRWEYQEDALLWIPFCGADSYAIDKLWHAWLASSNPQDGGSKFFTSIGNTVYEVDFYNMQQTHVETGEVNALRRQDSQGQSSAACSSSQTKQVDTMSKLAAAEARAEAAEARALLADAAATLAREQCEAANLTLKTFLKEVEMWRQPAVFGISMLEARPQLQQLVQDTLRHMVPQDHVVPCDALRNAVVTSVDQIVNTHLWNHYCFRRSQLMGSLKHRQACPQVDVIAPRTQELQSHLPYFCLERAANEVLLFHGTTEHNAMKIVRQGFDERLTTHKLYGRGVYLTTDTCKAAQYCDRSQAKVVILARVILGHPFMAEGPMPTHERPPEIPGEGVPHDSVIAKPGIPNDLRRPGSRQTHWEFVVPRGDCQIYPELLVRFM